MGWVSWKTNFEGLRIAAGGLLGVAPKINIYLGLEARFGQKVSLNYRIRNLKEFDSLDIGWLLEVIPIEAGKSNLCTTIEDADSREVLPLDGCGSSL